MKYTIKTEQVLGMEVILVKLYLNGIILDSTTILAPELAHTWAKNAARKYKQKQAG